MPYITKYTVRQNKMKRASKFGVSLTEKTEFIIDPAEDGHYIFLPVFDSGIEDGKWGRLSFSIELDEDMSFSVMAFATNERMFMRKEELTDINTFLCDDDINPSIKMAFFDLAEGIKKKDQNDILLYELSGRYLWLAISIEGSGNGSISNIVISNPGDTFMNMFPEIYREWNGFFHRYMSVFSSLFNDFQYKIDEYAENLNVDTAPPELLEIYASWMGIDVSGNFLDEEALRTLVREGPELNRKKGTKAALERLTEIILGEKSIVVEKKIAGDSDSYGESVYDVSILVKKFVDEKKKAQLFFLLQQFVPIRTRLQIIYLAQKSELDTHSYLDINAAIYSTGEAKLDEHMILDDNTILGE